MPQHKDIYLSAKSFKEASKFIRQYKKELLTKKIQEFVDELSFVGEQEIERVLIGWVDTGTTLGSLERLFNEDDGKSKCIIRVSSDAILYLEFGSGVVGESTSHPLASQYGYGPFTNTKVNTEEDIREHGWHFVSSHSGASGDTFGLPALMPMYKGGKKMRREIEKVAKEVFG